MVSLMFLKYKVESDVLQQGGGAVQVNWLVGYYLIVGFLLIAIGASVYSTLSGLSKDIPQKPPPSFATTTGPTESGTVTALSVVGIVFGVFSLLGFAYLLSSIFNEYPSLRSEHALAYDPLVPPILFTALLFTALLGTFVSFVSYLIARSRRVRRTVPVVALALNLVAIMPGAIGVISSGVVQSLRGASQQARRVKAEADISEIKTALDRYHSDTGSYPTSDQGLQALVSPPLTGGSPKDYQGPYIEKLPPDPWGHPYFFQSDGRSYVLKSFGADGIEGGEGANADIETEP
jgi:general secretion pathway protein G